MKGTDWGIIAILGLVALFALGYIKIQGVPQPTAAGGTLSTIPAGVVAACQNVGPYTTSTAVQDDLYTTGTNYVVSSIAFANAAGNVVATGTTNGGTTLSYLSTNVPCSVENANGKLYVLTSSTINGGVIPYNFGGSISGVFNAHTTNFSSISMTLRNTALTNLSSDVTTGNAWSTDTVNETAAVTMGSGETRTVLLELNNLTGQKQFGASELGVIWAIDTADSTAFSANAISLSSSYLQLQPMTCPADVVQKYSVERCYKSGAIPASAGYAKIDITMTSDVGNPGTSADPIIYAIPIGYYQEDGKIKVGSFNKGNTAVGGTVQKVTLNNS